MESDKQSQAIASLLSMALGYIKPMTLKCALDLGIPEEISNYGAPMTLTQLQSGLSLPESKKTHLHHLLRILTHFGFIHVQAGETEDSEATYDLTPTSRLVSNKKGSLNLSLFVHCQLEAGINLLLKAFVCMGDWFKQDDKEMPFELAYGCGLWEMASKNPKLNDMFNEAMVSYCSTFDDAIIKKGAEIFKGVGSLVDVAGGTGGVTKAIAANFPHVQCTVLDLPHVVQDVPNDGVVKFVAGDMFKYIPPADAVLLKSTLHCFGDDDCVKILKRCKEAIGSKGTGGKVILMESVVGTSRATTVEEAKLLFDLLMLNNHAGAERDEHEWDAIFKRAGFSSYKIVVTVGSISVMEVYP